MQEDVIKKPTDNADVLVVKSQLINSMYQSAFTGHIVPGVG